MSSNNSSRGGQRPRAGRPTLKEKKKHDIEWAKEAVKNRWTMEHLIPLRDPLINVKGRSYSLEENKVALLFILDLMIDEKLNKSDACQQVAKRLHRHYGTLLSLLNHYVEYEEIMDTDTANRGRGSKLYINSFYHLSVEHCVSIGEFIINAQQEGSGSTVTSIADYLSSTFNIKVCYSTLLYTLHKLGYKYGDARVVSVNKDRQPRIRKFLIEYANALELEEKGDAVIVYMDESYVNTRHALNTTWYDPLQRIGNQVIRGTGKGGRLIIVHAVSKYGLLHHTATSEGATGIQLTAEMIWTAAKESGDYHKNMDGAMFLNWIDCRLFPTFEKLFPSRKLILVLDNVSYHHVRGPDFIDPLHMRKIDVANQLKQYDIRVISVEREDEKLEFSCETWDRHGGSKAPTAGELRQALSKHLQTIGYLAMPQLQPIELVWAYVKHYVADKFKLGRSIQKLREDTLHGLYGADKHVGVTAEFCNKIINHCHSIMNRYITEDSHLSGTIQKLTVTVSSTFQSDILTDTSLELDGFIGEMEDDYQEQEQMEQEHEQ